MVTARRAPRARTSRVTHGDFDAEQDGDPRAHVRDGVYDAFILWVESRDDGALTFDITITAGEHKGEVIVLNARPSSARAALGSDDPITLVGLPCTLRVEHGRPTVARG